MQARTAGTYALARFLRIYPGLIVCVAVVAFFIAPLTAGVTGRRFAWLDALLYFATNLTAGTPQVAVAGIPGTLDGLPDPRLWNGPLWTLFWEIACYVLVGVVFGIFRPELARLALSRLIVAPLAWLSCRYVEGPARRWRRSTDALRRVPELA